MDPTSFFLAIEETSLSIWLRESPSIWAFPFVLILHTVGLAFLVGTNVAVNARMLGVARGVPLLSMDPFFRAMWLGFWVNAASGVLLLLAYPAKALTNPLFYVKLALIGVALSVSVWIRTRIHQQPGFGELPMAGALKTLAVASLACWFSAVTAGRLLAYTYSRLMAVGF